MHYLLDLETLLIFLSRQYQSGELSADLKRFPGLASKKGYRVRILLMQGKMASCTVRNEEGKLLIEGEAALKALLKIGRLTGLPRASFSLPNCPALSMDLSRIECSLCPGAWLR